MSNTYLLSDGEYKKRYPAYSSLNMSKFYTVVLIEQETTVNDALGDSLYAETMTQAGSGLNLESHWEGLIELLQTMLIYSVSIGLIDFNTEDGKFYKDRRTANLDSKVNFIKSKIKKYIAKTSELSAYVTQDDTYDDQSYSGSPVHFWND